ncbi:MAG TPA: tetratricopeptide repeat protein [Pyrinomonadaceae bacterium]|nr:tetratricopeptide repeat protein [Pyrinomonadaceae bacterium]
MSRPCPNCGTICAAEARFCRLCGTPLRVAGATGEAVSPGAQTAPLSDEGRTTHGLPTDDGSASAPETARVRRSELENILRRSSQPAPVQPAANNSQALDGNETTAAPVTTALAQGTDGAGVRADRAAAATIAANVARPEATVKADGAESAGRAAAPATVKRQAARTRRGFLLAGLTLAALAVGLSAFALYRSRRDDSPTAGAPASTNDPKRAVEERLAEAESLLAEGRTAEAISRLRAAIRLEPSNAKAHRMLAEALERNGAVNEAIEEYRAAVQSEPGNEETQLRYADALRRVGRTDEAREIYQKLSASSSSDVSREAKAQLDALPPPQSALNNGETRSATQPGSTEEARGTENTQTASSTTSASSSSTAARAGTTPPPANGTGASRPKNDPVASYNTAMKIIEGKDIRKMNRAELIRAYELFQYAQAGPKAADANRRLQELDKELFERRKRGQ